MINDSAVYCPICNEDYLFEGIFATWNKEYVYIYACPKCNGKYEI